MSAVNTHVPMSQRLDVTRSQARFATPRGYTQDGDSDSGHAAQHLDPDASSLRNDSQADSTATESLDAVKTFWMSCRPQYQASSESITLSNYLFLRLHMELGQASQNRSEADEPFRTFGKTATWFL
jgi:hypothetical protein